MGFFYNEDVFQQAGVDATQIKTWNDYYEAAKKLKQIGAYIAADSGRWQLRPRRHDMACRRAAFPYLAGR